MTMNDVSSDNNTPCFVAMQPTSHEPWCGYRKLPVFTHTISRTIRQV